MKITIVILLSLLFSFSTCSQPEEKLTLQEGEILGKLHEANIGKIVFSNGYIPFKDFSEKDFITSFNLTDDSNLNMRFFLGKTLTYYMQELAPNLSVNELCEKGNYFFSFYVDEKLIYEEALNTGAGSCSYRNSATVQSIPLASTENEDMWGRFMWMRFMERGGGNKALSEGTHQLKITIQPYLKNPELKKGKIIAEGEVAINVIKREVMEKEIKIQAIAPTNEWNVSTAPYDKEKIRALNKKIAQREFKRITSVVVIKDNELLLEEYFNGADRNTIHDTRSVGKTFASTMLGIAIKDGHIKNENVLLQDFFDLKEFQNYSKKKENVTLKSLLTMSSAFEGSDEDYDSPGNEENMYPTSDWVKFTLDLPMREEQKIGKQWDYFTAGVVILGNAIDQRSPNNLDVYSKNKLFEPLGIKNYKWQYTPRGVVNTAGGLRMSALDYAKYGQLYKNGGTWKGESIIPKDWVTKSLSAHLELPDNRGQYGYLFWIKKYTVNGKDYEAAYCSGNGGNKIFIFKDLPLVIVITATAYGQPYAHPQVDRMMEEFILPAVI